MKDLIKKQKLFFISLFGIVVVSLALMTTFAYQTLGVNIKDGSSDELRVKAGVLDVNFSTTRRINLNNMPLLNSYDTAEYIEFTVDNTNSTEDVQYKILLNSLEYSNELVTEDFKYTIVKVNDNIESIISNGDFKDLSGNEYAFVTNYGDYIYIKRGEVQKIRIYLWLKETEKNQNHLENTYFKGIIELNSYFAKDINDKSITNFKIYGNTSIVYDNDNNLQSTLHPVKYNFLGSYIDQENNNYGKYKIYLKALGNNLFKTDELFIKESDNWVYQNIYLNKGTYRINYNGDFKYIMVKDLNGNIIINKTLYTEPFDILNDGEYKVYIGDDNYKFESVQNPEFYLASLVNDINYDFSKYESYIEPITYTIYLDEPLRCVNDICDYIDFINNIVVRKVDSLILKSSNKWVLDKSNGFDTYVTNLTINSSNALSTHFIYSNELSINNFNINNGKLRIIYANKNTSDIDSFKEWLDNNEVVVYYIRDNESKESIESLNLSKFINKKIVVNDDNIIGKIEIEYDK